MARFRIFGLPPLVVVVLGVVVFLFWKPIKNAALTLIEKLKTKTEPSTTPEVKK